MHVYLRELFLLHNSTKETFAVVLHKKAELKKKEENVKKKRENGQFALPTSQLVGNQRKKTLESLKTREYWECVIFI